MKIKLVSDSQAITLNVPDSDVMELVRANPSIQFHLNLSENAPQNEYNIYLVGKPVKYDEWGNNKSLIHSYKFGTPVDKIKAIKLMRSTFDFDLLTSKDISETSKEQYLGKLPKHQVETFVNTMREFGYECHAKDSNGKFYF